VRGTRQQAEALLEQLAGRVEALGLRLKSEKTAVTHIDGGFLFLGQRIVRRPKGKKRYVYTFVSNEALASARRKVKALTGRSTTNLELSELIAALNPVLRGRGNYFRHAAAKRTLRIPRLLRLVASRALASQEAPAADLEADPTALRQRGHLPAKGIALF
jgi:RNA-directed DNA polymerase